MFGGDLERPRRPQCKKRPDPEFQDNLLTSIQPGIFGHLAREPNTDYKMKLMQYKQRNSATYQENIDDSKMSASREKYNIKFHQQVNKKRVGTELNARVKKKMEEYDLLIEEKRERLRKLIADDERVFYKETVENLQKGKQLKLLDIKEKIAKLKSEREAERLKVVEEKRILQYADRCESLRPAMSKKHLIESKVIQLQQMRENEARRQAEKELESMWCDVMSRDTQARMEREKQEVLDHHKRMQNQKEILEMQIKGKQQVKEEVQRTKEEDRLELEKVAEQLKREQLDSMRSERQKKLKVAKELKEQIAFQEKLLAERTKVEKELENAYNYLSNAQYEQEKQKALSSTTQAKREMVQYRQYLTELEKRKKEEDKKYDELLEEYRKSIEKKQDDARCKVLEAKEKLLKDTIEGIAEQREYKLKLAQQELRQKEAENELLMLNFETNTRLTEEQHRSEFCAKLKYKDDLQKQINYNNLLKERERLEMERQLELGRQEEEKYRKKVQEIIERGFELGERHPFRTVLEQYDCACPTLQPKY